MKGTLYEKIFKRMARGIFFMAIYVSYIYCNFLDNSTMYVGLQNSTAIVTINDVDLDYNYKYNFGIRKIGLFPYQDRDRFYKGDENELSDNAILGAVNGWEYLFNISSIRNQGLEFTDQEYWFKWSNNWFVTKAKYINKESRDLEFFDYDARFRLNLNKVNFTVGGAIRMHPAYGHHAILDYEGYWWDLAYEYGYQDYMIPETDLNDNGVIDDPYYVWIETDPETLEGYWVEFYEGTSYYWEDPDGNQIAFSDAEFFQYHLPAIIEQYNEDNKIKDWQAELSIVIGLDVLLGGDKFYSHTWVNLFPKSFGLTDKAYEGDEMQYDIGVMLGINLSEHIGVFIEGSRLNYYGRKEHNLSTGVNWRF